MALHEELNFGRVVNRSLRSFAHRTAIVDGEYSTDYAGHFGRVKGVVERLTSDGVRKFGVLAMNSHYYLELWHAALCSDLVIVPLNFRLSPPEIAAIIEDSQIDALLVDAEWSALAARASPEIRRLEVESYFENLPEQSEPVRFDEAVADKPSALVYTGGTTGLPKAAVVSNRALALNMHHMDRAMNTQEEICFLLHSPMFHAGPLYGIMNPFGSGGSVVLLPKFDVQDFARAVSTTSANATQMGPTMLRMILDELHDDLTPLRQLRTLLYGTAPITRGLVTRVLDLLPDLRLFNGYGMTEATSALTILTHEQHIADNFKRVDSVGRPLAGVDIRIAQLEDGAECPVGVVGEVQARAGNLMTEYWQRPELTANAFEGDWFHTGDLGYFDDEGFLYLVDRLKDMIITGGENVYSAEVENVISLYPGVSQVAVMGMSDEKWGEQVHAVVVPDPGVSLDFERIDSFCRESLAGYKIPRVWELRTDPLPVSGAMKLNKRALRDGN